MSDAQHVFEIAPSGRSKCRGCGEKIEKDSLRFGEKLPNPFGDGDMTHWHHPECAAHRRPESLASVLANYPEGDAERLASIAQHASKFPRLQRMGKLEQASSGRARCRHCNELIEKDTWRIPLIFFNEDTYATSGFIHLSCTQEYTETDQLWPTLARFAGELDTETEGQLKALVN